MTNTVRVSIMGLTQSDVSTAIELLHMFLPCDHAFPPNDAVRINMSRVYQDPEGFWWAEGPLSIFLPSTDEGQAQP